MPVLWLTRQWRWNDGNGSATVPIIMCYVKCRKVVPIASYDAIYSHPSLWAILVRACAIFILSLDKNITLNDWYPSSFENDEEYYTHTHKQHNNLFSMSEPAIFFMLSLSWLSIDFCLGSEKNRRDWSICKYHTRIFIHNEIVHVRILF